MLDGQMRRIFVPALDRMALALAGIGLRANHLTLAGSVAALGCGGLISVGALNSALILLALSRLADGLDGALARVHGPSDFGGLLDIFCDFAFYSAIPLGFAVFDPAENAIAACCLLASFYLNAASFLGFASLAAKRGMRSEVRGVKSLYFTTGLAEGTETILVFVAMVLFPSAFAPLALGFALICIITALARMALARRVFGDDPDRT